MKKIIWLIILNSIFYNLFAQTNYSKDLAVADFREYISFLEETHPEPYNLFGGEKKFHEEVEKTIKKISEKGVSKYELQILISEFGSKLHDGHTFVLNDNPHDITNDKILNLKLKILADGLSVSQSPNGKLNGLKIFAINDISIGELLNKVQLIKPCENISGAYFSLVQMLMRKSSASELLGQIDNNKIRLNFLNSQIEPIDEEVEYVNRDERKIQPNSSTFDLKISKTIPFEYKYIDSDKKIVWFVYNSTFSREVIELQKQWGQDYTNNLAMLYELFNLGNVPQNYEEAIDKIPSMNEVFFELLESMKKNNSSHLIIDLRENGGGWNPINLPTLYMMKGDAYFAYRCKAEYNTRISQPFLQKMNTTIDEYNLRNNTNHKIGDYSVSSFFKSYPEEMSLKERRMKYLEDDFNENFTTIDLLKKINGDAVYTPKIIVVTSPATFSAAFQYAFLLKEICNATIVGVSSSQAYNSGTGTTFYTLTNTKIKGSVSNSYQLFDSENKIKERMLQPDYQFLWEDFLKYNSHEDAEILYIIDLINQENINQIKN